MSFLGSVELGHLAQDVLDLVQFPLDGAAELASRQIRCEKRPIMRLGRYPDAVSYRRKGEVLPLLTGSV
jgi:hypothetical protein